MTPIKLSPGWRLCGSKAEPRLLNTITGQVIETYPEDIRLLLTALRGRPVPAPWLFSTIQQKVLSSTGTNTIHYVFGPRILALDDIQLDILQQCNHNCPHCYQNAAPDHSGQLTLDQIDSILEQAHKLGAARIAISGGEPLLYPNLQTVIDKIVAHRLLMTAIFTNLSIQDLHLPSYTHILMSYSPAMGCVADPTVIRSTAAKYTTTVNTITVNGSELEALYDMMVDLKISRWRVGVVRPVGRGKDIKIDMPTVVNVYRRLFDRYMSEYGASHSPFEFQIGFAFQSRFLDTQHIDLYPDNAKCCYYKRRSLCVKWNGTVTACSMDSRPIGTWNNLEQAWIHAADNKPVTNSLKNCKDCELLHLCNGGCRICCADDSCDEISYHTYMFFKSILPILEDHGCQIVTS